MITLDIENPIYYKNKFDELFNNSKINYCSHSYIRPNLDNIIKDVSEYFSNNINNYLIMKDLIDGALGPIINININNNTSEILNDISLRMIDYYCHEYEKEWYRNMCLKYKLSYNFMSPLSCFIRGNKIKVLLKDNAIELSFTNLIFYKHLFEDKIYEKISLNKIKLGNEMEKLAKRNRKKVNLNNETDSNYSDNNIHESYHEEDFMNGQIVGLPLEFIIRNKLFVMFFLLIIIFYVIFIEYLNNDLLDNFLKINDGL